MVNYLFAFVAGLLVGFVPVFFLTGRRLKKLDSELQSLWAKVENEFGIKKEGADA